jgi:CheY-like chemotaxis protein
LLIKGEKNEWEHYMPRVLVVEDEQNIRFLVAIVLQQKGYEVVEAESGPEALEILNQDDRFDAILSDLRMPKMDALMYIEALKREVPRIPVIIMSAHTTSAWAKEAVQQGVACLQKPFTRQQLVDILQNMTSTPHM